MRHKFTIVLKWYKNDSGGDRRAICIDYNNTKEKKAKINNVLNDFRSAPMDIGKQKGKIPYSVQVAR